MTLRIRYFAFALFMLAMCVFFAGCEDDEVEKNPEIEVQKCYFFETDILAENGITDLSKYQYAVRGKQFLVRFVVDSDNWRYNESELLIAHDSYRIIDVADGSLKEGAFLYSHSGDDMEQYLTQAFMRKLKICPTKDGTELMLIMGPTSAKQIRTTLRDGTTTLSTEIVDGRTKYYIMGWNGNKRVIYIDSQSPEFGDDFNEVPEMISCDDGHIILYCKTSQSFFIVSEDGKTIKRATSPGGESGFKEGLYLHNGKAVFCRTNSGANGVTHTVYTLDCEAGSFDEGVELTADKGSTQFLLPDGYAIGYRNAEGVFGVTDSGETVKIFGWLDVGLTGAMVEDIWSIGKDEFFLIYNDSVDKKTHSGIVKRADEAEYLEFKASRANSETSAAGTETSGTETSGTQVSVTPSVKTIRVVAETMTNSNSSAFEYVQRFNRKNMDYKVEVESIAGGAGEAASNLMKKMLSGDIPDVVMFGKSLRSGDLKGQNMFVDLYPYIDADKEHGRDSFLPCVLEPFEKADGTLQLLTTEFTLKTLIGSTDTLGKLSDWTFDEMLDFAEGLDDVALAYLGIPSSWTAAKGFLNMMGYALLNEFIDFDGRVCDFTDGRFARLLEICKNSTYSTAPTKTPDLRGIYNGEIALTFANLDGPAEYMYATGCTYFGREPVLIGYPHGDGDSGTIILPKMQFAISKNCADKNAAWKLISFFVDSQTEVWEGVREAPESFRDQDAFPCGKKASETMLDVSKDMYAMLTVIEGKSQFDGQPTRKESKYAGAKMVEKISINEDGEEVVEMVEVDYASPEKRAKLVTMVSPDEDGMAFYATFDDDDAEILRKLFGECKTIYGTNAAAVNIILEEGEAYFTGGKSLDAVVKMVQDRVTTQINE